MERRAQSVNPHNCLSRKPRQVTIPSSTPHSATPPLPKYRTLGQPHPLDPTLGQVFFFINHTLGTRKVGPSGWSLRGRGKGQPSGISQLRTVSLIVGWWASYVAKVFWVKTSNSKVFFQMSLSIRGNDVFFLVPTRQYQCSYIENQSKIRIVGKVDIHVLTIQGSKNSFSGLFQSCFGFF